MEGEATLKGFELADRGVGKGAFTLGDRRVSKTFPENMVPGVVEAGVVSCGRLDLVFSLRGLGEPLRSAAGDFGGTWGGNSPSSWITSVSTLRAGLADTPGLRIGDRGFPKEALTCSEVGRVAAGSGWAGEGPVTHDIKASPNGPFLQFVPGALLDRS